MDERGQTPWWQGAVHDLKTPLHAALSYLDLLRDRHSAAFDEDAAEKLDRAARLVEQSLAAVASLLDASLGAARERLDMAEVAKQVSHLLQADLEARGATLRIDVVGEADGAADLTQRIVTNLVKNALDHGGRGIRLRGRVDGDSYRLTCDDDGPGVSADVLPRIFEFGARGDGDGHGVGLASSRLLARAMDGDLVHDGGSSFSLRLPTGRAR